MTDVKIRTKFNNIIKAFGRGEVSDHIKALLFKDGETLCTPNTGVKVTYLGGGWFHLGGYSYSGFDVRDTLEAIYG